MMRDLFRLADYWIRRPARPLLRFAGMSHRDNVLFLASALSFDALLASIPLALLIISVLGFVLSGKSPDTVANILQMLLPAGQGAEPLTRAQGLIEGVIATRRELSLYGIPLFLVFSTRLFASVRIALNEIQGVRVRRGFLHAVGVDVLLVLITSVLFAANSLVSIPVFHVSVLDRVSGHLLASGFAIILFFVVYSLAPDEEVRWDTALVAALFVAIAFEAAKVVFSLYLAQFATINRLISHPNAIALILFVFWIYYSALIFLLGAEVGKIYDRYKRTTALEPSA
ncbi:MAG: YihY/virulence factor BrkB family protein [Gemmatimonadales bacterium]